jgi:hypothetical protein
VDKYTTTEVLTKIIRNRVFKVNKVVHRDDPDEPYFEIICPDGETWEETFDAQPAPRVLREIAAEWTAEYGDGCECVQLHEVEIGDLGMYGAS